MLHTHTLKLSIEQKLANIAVGKNIEKIIDIFGAKKDRTNFFCHVFIVCVSSI